REGRSVELWGSRGPIDLKTLSLHRPMVGSSGEGAGGVRGGLAPGAVGDADDAGLRYPHAACTGEHRVAPSPRYGRTTQMAVDLSVSYRAKTTARAMAEAANRFLDSLNDAQRDAATFPFAGDERYIWNYRPTPRNGLRLMNMTREQQALALALLDSGLSERAAAQARWIMELDDILREHERAEGRV